MAHHDATVSRLRTVSKTLFNMDGATMSVNEGETKMDRWCDFDYGYIPAVPLADFWREHDACQRAKRTIRNNPELAALIMRRREILMEQR